jgi:ribosome-binding protein aMBF1 (putative translation factor)
LYIKKKQNQRSTGGKEINQSWLAVKLGKSNNMVDAYAQERQQPRLESFKEIAKLLDVDIKDLIVSSKPKEHE